MISGYQNVVVLFLTSVSLWCVNSQNITDAMNLRTYIFTTNPYDAKIRPIVNQTRAINVYVSLYLLNLNELDEVKQTMTTTGYLYVSWHDEQLGWTPANFGGITKSFWPQDDVWTPDITLQNSVSQYSPLGDPTLYVHVLHTGEVVWQPFQLFHSTCSVTITNFPFDIQTCELEFVAWSYTKYEVILLGNSESGIDLSKYVANPSWKILDVSWIEESNDIESSIVFKIKIKRKPMYVILSIVFPILLLSILNSFTFTLPCDGGEKTGYAVTIFLSFAVFLTIVESTLPANSDSVALFSIYVILMTLKSTIVTIITLIENRVSAWDTNEVEIPSWVKALANLGKCMSCKLRVCNRKSKNRRRVSAAHSGKGNVTHSDEELREVEDTASETEVEYTWKTVINGVDLFCFILFCTLAVLINFLFLILTSAG